MRLKTISLFSLALVRHMPRPSSKALFYHLYTISLNYYSINLALRKKRTALRNVCGIPSSYGEFHP